MAPQKQKKEVDGRFSRVQRDPRFWEMPEKQNKVKIDERFRSMFHDQRFKVRQTVDKRGRPVQHSTEEDLRRFYRLEEGEEEEEEGEGEEAKAGLKPLQPKADDENEGDSEDSEEAESGPDSDQDSDQDSEGSGSESDSGPDLARGKGNVETSSDEDSEDEVEAILKREEEEIEHDWGELCKDAPRSDQVWRRMAVCNMDWDRIKAKDLLALFQSFCPKGGAVLSVKIFLSKFGKERLQQEQSQAPLQLQTLPEDSEDDTEEDKSYRERMRQYQFGRLKYYFAVVECDGPQTAAQIYSECDGFEYESSGSVLDLRFIPDDVQFEEDPKDSATDVNLTSYCPNLFSSTSSSTAKVQLTWDETDHERVTALNRKFNKEELLNMDFRAYLASSSEEEEPEEEPEEEEGPKEEQEEGQDGVCNDKPAPEKPQSRSELQILKYRELLQSIRSREQEEQEEEGGMEVTWVPGLKQSAEQKLKTRLDSEKLSPWDQYLHKKKEKKKKKRKQDQDSELGLSDDDLPSDVDLNDPFFKDELSTTEVKKSLKKKKQKRSRASDEEEEQDPEEQRRRAQMVLLMEEDQDDLKHKHFDFDRIVEQQNLSKNKKKKLKKSGLQPDQDQFQVDVSDPRFQAVYSSALFNLDPSHPGFRRTKGTESLLQEKQRRRMDTQGAPPLGPSAAVTTATASPVATLTSPVSVTTKKTGLDPGLSQLVKSIKSKTQQHQERRKRQ